MTQINIPDPFLFSPAWFTEQLRQGFAHLAQVRGYTDKQFRDREAALTHPEPMPDKLDDLLVNLGVLSEED